MENGACSDTTYHNLNGCIGAGETWSKNLWKYPGCLDAVFDEFSTSLVWNKLMLDESNNTSFENISDCEYIINQGVIADQIYFSDSIQQIKKIYRLWKWYSPRSKIS